MTDLITKAAVKDELATQPLSRDFWNDMNKQVTEMLDTNA